MRSADESIYVAVKSGFYSFSFILALFWNSLIIISTFRHKALQKPINVLVCNLCVVDLFIVLLGIPLHTSNKHVLFQSNCNVFEPLLSAFVTANVFTLVTIAIERYVVVLNSVKSCFKLDLKKSITVSILLDLAAVTLALPKVIFQRKDFYGCCFLDGPVKNVVSYVSFLFLIQYLGPFLAMTYLYLQIWYKIRTKNKTFINLFNKNRSMTNKTTDSNSVSGNSQKSIEFKSESCNHLAIKKRRSVSLDDLHSLNDSISNIKTFFPSTIELNNRRPSLRRCNSASIVTRRQQQKENIVERSSSFTTNNGYHDRTLKGSIQRFHRSLTSVIVGTDLEQAQAYFTTLRYKQTMKTLKVFFLLLFIFIVCLLPYQINNFIDLKSAASCRQKRNFLNILIYINAAVNPLLYGGLNSQLQKAFNKLFISKVNGIQFLLKQNMFRTPSGNIVFGEGSIKHKNALIYCLQIKCFGRQKRRCSIERADARSLKMKRESIREERRISLHQNKTSKGETKPVTEEVIPVCAPIIVITCYDDELNYHF